MLTTQFSYMIIYLLFTHFVADFVWQSDKMAINKSKSNMWLSIHVLMYCNVFLIMTFPLFIYLFGGVKFLFVYIGFNGVLHWITDYFTSRLSSYLYDKNRHYFFVTIGFDQFVHAYCLIATFNYVLLQ